MLNDGGGGGGGRGGGDGGEGDSFRAGDETQGLVYARKTLYLSYIPSPIVINSKS